MTPSEHFWTLIHELAEVVDENVRDRQVTAAFAADLQALPAAIRQNYQRDLHVVSFALAHLSENLLPSQSWDFHPGSGENVSATVQDKSTSDRQMKGSLSALDNEGSPIPGVSHRK